MAENKERKQGWVESILSDESDDFIEGYDIELDAKSRERIDRLVNSYEEIILSRVEEEYSQTARASDKLADKIASFGGSWKFIGFMTVFLGLWIVWNLLPFTPWHFDGAPFILLNLLLSFTAAFQAPVIMMSQNRQAARDKHESIIDFAINYKAEQEIDDMQSHLHRLEMEIHDLKRIILESQEKQK